MNDKMQIVPATLKDGELTVTGFKHLLVSIVSASLCHPNCKIKLTNVPNILETKILIKILRSLNCIANLEGGTIYLETSNLSNDLIPTSLSMQIHGSLYLWPSLVFRHGKALLLQTGGCQIGNKSLTGARPVHHMIKVLEHFGCRIEKGNGSLIAYADEPMAANIDIMEFSERHDVLTGPLISGATKTAILAALNINYGITTIKNPYTKPDAFELLEFAKQLGHHIEYSKSQITIQRNSRYRPSLNFKLIPDLSQVMTFITLALYCKIEITIIKIDVKKLKEGLQQELIILKHIGVEINFATDSLTVCKRQNITETNIEVTSLGIYSDHQPFFALILSMASKSSRIHEHVWIDRFSYVDELQKLGLPYERIHHGVIIHPMDCSKKRPSKAVTLDLYAKDLRAAAALLIAALAQSSASTLHGARHLERGYDDLIQNVKQLGANITLCEVAEVE